uniref:Uncharacterized protein n=1 Tax=Ascaris lumbricoides TaxID=6252 RepID=A0A0M3HFM4_ASCLU
MYAYIFKNTTALNPLSVDLVLHRFICCRLYLLHSLNQRPWRLSV